ncbi:hypothetical protein ACFWX0_31705, partial [Nonomuraea sp. NPDC059022]
MDIGPYRILRELGRGGQGTVYLGRDDRGELAAVKVVHGFDRAFDRELAAARQVAEFCTARVLRADLDHNPPYVASEFIDGPALHQVAPRGGGGGGRGGRGPPPPPAPPPPPPARRPGGDT